MKCVPYFAELLAVERYLEIGLDRGDTIMQTQAAYKVGIEVAEIDLPVKVYRGESDAVFASEAFDEEPFDMVFIDGLHEYTQVVRDIRNTLKYLKDKGVILVDDVNPMDKPDYVSSKERSSTVWCGDVWKTVPHVRFLMPELDYWIINDFPGTMVIMRADEIRKTDGAPDGINMDVEYPFDNTEIDWLRENRHVMNYCNFKDGLRKAFYRVNP